MLIQLSDKTVRLYFEHTLIPRLDSKLTKGHYKRRGLSEDLLADLETELAGFEALKIQSKRRSWLERMLRTPQTTARLEYVESVGQDGKRTWRELTHASVRKFAGDLPQSRSAAALHAFHALIKAAPVSASDKATLAREFIQRRHRQPSVRELKREITRLRAEIAQLKA